jgi:hypothetical protein
MSQVKISELPLISTINANTANTLFAGVDVPTSATFRMTAHTLAQGLYSNEVLNVGTNPIYLPNTVAQFSLNGQSYVQTNLVNTNDGGSADIVITANANSGGTDSANFIDMGYANKFYQPGQEFNNIGTAINPLDGYLYVQGTASSNGGNLIVGTTTSNTELRFIVGGGSAQNIVAKMTSTGLVMNTQSFITFADGTKQTTAAASNAYSQAAFAQANLNAGGLVTANANISFLYGIGTSQNTNIQSAWNKANTSVQNTAVITLNSVTLTGNLIANTLGTSVSIDNFTSNSATFSKNVVILNNLSANTLLGNIFFSNVVTTTSQSNSILWFPQATNVSQQVAQLWYYSNTQSLILDTDIPGDRLSISKVLFFRGFNSTGATIPANSVIRLTTGVTANQIPYIALADATNSANATVAGFVKVAIANGAFGFAYSQGIVEDFNTTGLGQNGDILFLSTTPGVASNIAPLSGNSNTVVQLGKVILSDATQGKLFIQNQLRQAYGRPNGSLLYAFANNITSSNTISINDSTGVLNANTIIANTFVYGSATANAMVTQLTSKSTAVTANGMSGQITMNNAALAGQGYVTFTVNNSYVKHVNDIPFVAVQNSVTTPNPYQVCVGGVAVGSFNISVYNSDSGGGSSHSDAIVLNWGLMRVGN